MILITSDGRYDKMTAWLDPDLGDRSDRHTIFGALWYGLVVQNGWCLSWAVRSLYAAMDGSESWRSIHTTELINLLRFP